MKEGRVAGGTVREVYVKHFRLWVCPHPSRGIPKFGAGGDGQPATVGSPLARIPGPTAGDAFLQFSLSA